MSRLGHRVQKFALCALMLALIALGIGVARAEVGAKWTVVNPAGELIEVKKGGLSPSLQLEVEGKDLTMLTTLFGLETEILCTGSQLVGAKLEAEGKVTSGAKLKLTGCSVAIQKMQLGCTVLAGTESGVILSEKLKILLALHEGSTIFRLEPIEGTLFMNIHFNKECGLAEIPIGGNLTLKDNELRVELQKHLLVQGPLTTLAVPPGNPVTLDGSMWLGLGGEHVGLKWSGTPG